MKFRKNYTKKYMYMVSNLETINNALTFVIKRMSDQLRDTGEVSSNMKLNVDDFLNDSFNANDFILFSVNPCPHDLANFFMESGEKMKDWTDFYDFCATHKKFKARIRHLDKLVYKFQFLQKRLSWLNFK